MSIQSLPATAVDAAFLRRVYVYSLVLAGLAALVLAQTVSRPWGLGFAAAGVWSVANFWALERLMRMGVGPGPKDPVAIMIAGAVKAPVLYGLGAVIVVFGKFPPLSLIAGFSVPMTVLVLKVIGRILSAKMNASNELVGTGLSDQGSQSQVHPTQAREG